MASIREETVRGIKWGLIQKCTMQPVQFLYGIILARLISPAEMGILGLTAIFFALAGQLQQCGFGSALIRKQNRTDEDICTVFWFNVTMSLMLSSLLFLAAPWFAWFFNQPALINLTRVSALLMFLNSTVSVHMTLYQAQRNFKTPAIVSMCATLTAMPFTIWAAFAGWSYWAPMLQGVITGILTLITIWIISPWKPKFVFSSSSFKEFFSFGVNLAASGMLTILYRESRSFIIGKFYSPAQLACYHRGEQLCSTPLMLLHSIFSPVIFPILSTLQNNTEKLYSVFRKNIRIISMISQWGMITIAANAQSLVFVLYGEQWLQAAEYVQILCFGWMLNPILSINSTMFSVLGRTDIVLKIEATLRTFSIAAMIGCSFISVKAICIAGVLSSVFAFTLSSCIICRISQLRIIHIIRDFFPYLAFALLANIPSILLTMQNYPRIVKISVGSLSSLLIFPCLLYLTKDTIASDIWSLFKKSPFISKLPFVR